MLFCLMASRILWKIGGKTFCVLSIVILGIVEFIDRSNSIPYYCSEHASLLLFDITSTLSAILETFSIVETRKVQTIKTQVMSGITIQMLSLSLFRLDISTSVTLSMHPNVPNMARNVNNTTPVMVEIFSIFLISMSLTSLS